MLTVFEFNSQAVRIVFVDGEPWWVAKDICEILGLSDINRTCSKLDEDEKGTHSMSTPGGNQGMIVVSESGLYSLVLRSRKPQAKVFKRWLTHDVIPSIRKTGGYSTQQHALPQTYKEALLALVAEIEAKEHLEAERQLLEEENHQLSEAVDELFDYSSIVRVAKFNKCSEKAFSWRKLKAASQLMELEIRRVPCPRFEYKNLYSHDVWRFVYPEYKLPETTTLVVREG